MEQQYYRRLTGRCGENIAETRSKGGKHTRADCSRKLALGCVVRGDTPHFDYVCAGTTQGIAHLNATTDTPVIYGLITTNTMEQAEDRAGGKLGNKGDECAITAIKMIDFTCRLKK